MTQTADNQHSLEWHDDMLLEHDHLDHVHQAFLKLLLELQQAKESESDQLRILERCIEHTQEHFDYEDAQMERLNFPARGCHMSEHHQVLGVMKKVYALAITGETEYIQPLAIELSHWLKIHVTTMDYAFVYFMQNTQAIDDKSVNNKAV